MGVIDHSLFESLVFAGTSRSAAGRSYKKPRAVFRIILWKSSGAITAHAVMIRLTSATSQLGTVAITRRLNTPLGKKNVR